MWRPCLDCSLSSVQAGGAASECLALHVPHRTQGPGTITNLLLPYRHLPCSCLTATDLYRYLAQEHDATIIGLLLGMAACKRWAQGAAAGRGTGAAAAGKGARSQARVT